MVADATPLLLLAPSTGFGGGIERVAAAVELAWPGPVRRVDLYRAGRVALAEGNPRAKWGFTMRALRTAGQRRGGWVLALHAGLLPVAQAAAAVAGSRSALMGIGVEVWGPMPALTRALLPRTDRLMAISSFTAEWMARRGGLDPTAIEILGLPVEERFLSAGQVDHSTLRATEWESTFITVSRIVSRDRYKGHFEVVKALPDVLERRPDARWCVVGTGDDLEALRHACEERGVAYAVNFLEGISDDALIEAYLRASCLVMPSVADPGVVPAEGEGFGLVYAEAGALGLPSIGSQSGGGSLDYLRDGETALLVPRGDSGALANAIVRLLDEPALRTRLGGAAREVTRSRHAPARFRTALVQALS